LHGSQRNIVSNLHSVLVLWFFVSPRPFLPANKTHA